MDGPDATRLLATVVERPAVLIAGPTASGKSALAVALARRLDGEIVNADSMQVYRDLRMLTARPSVEDEAAVPHHLFGHVDGARTYSVGDYLRDVRPVLSGIAGRGRRIIVVGGTGLYFAALTDGLIDTPEVPEAVRHDIEAQHAAGWDLYAMLAVEDPAAATKLRPADTPRLMRALEVVRATGRSIRDWQRAEAAPAPLGGGDWSGLFLAPDRVTLYARIDRRFQAMLDAGAWDEVTRLAARGLPANRGVMKAHGVPHLLAHLAGNMPVERAIELGQQDTRNYAKRQFTWARRRMADWTWLDEPALAALHAALTPLRP